MDLSLELHKSVECDFVFDLFGWQAASVSYSISAWVLPMHQG